MKMCFKIEGNPKVKRIYTEGWESPEDFIKSLECNFKDIEELIKKNEKEKKRKNVLTLCDCGECLFIKKTKIK